MQHHCLPTAISQSPESGHGLLLRMANLELFREIMGYQKISTLLMHMTLTQNIYNIPPYGVKTREIDLGRGSRSACCACCVALNAYKRFHAPVFRSRLYRSSNIYSALCPALWWGLGWQPPRKLPIALLHKLQKKNHLFNPDAVALM